MEIREARPDEMEQAFYLSAQAFGHGEKSELTAEQRLANPKRVESTTYGVWDAAGLQAKVAINHYQQHFGPDTIVPMGGIGGVASLPASRGKGYASACLRHVLERMREKGEVVSTLFPFSFEYYRRLGWEWVGVKREYSLATRTLMPDPGVENVRAATLEDRPGVMQAYSRFAGRYRGMIARPERLWNGILDDTKTQHTFTYLYEHSGEIEGYLTFRGGDGKQTSLREFVSLTARAQRALLGLLRRHDMQTERFDWSAPSDDTLWLQGFHWDHHTKILPMTMGRVVDVAGALRAWKPEREVRGRAAFAVEDANAPWNSGVWRVTFEQGQAAVENTDDAPDVTLDIQALSQAYYGTPTLSELRKADRIQVHDEAGYSALSRFFAGPPMYMNDFF